MANVTPKRYSEVLQTTGRRRSQDSRQNYEVQTFTRDTEVVAKLPQKRTRQYIYDLLTKISFPFKNIESIVERRGGMVDFTCETIHQAKLLATALQRHKEVEFARLVNSEFTDVKLHWVPGRFPNQKIVDAIERFHGKVYDSRMLRDRHGVADGRRLYKVKSEDLKAHPIAPTVRLNDMLFLVEYSGQPVQCFLCKCFGHIRNECPNAVTTPRELSSSAMETMPPSQTDEQPPKDDLINQEVKEPNAQGDASAPANSTSTPITSKAPNLQAPADQIAPHEEAAVSHDVTECRQHEGNALLQTAERPETDISEFSPTSSEAAELPDHSVFSTDEENIEAGTKRQHSPDNDKDQKQKASKKGETYDCICGTTIALPRAAGVSYPCSCGRLHVKCTCENVVATFGDMPANCNKCRKPVPRRHLDVTM